MKCNSCGASFDDVPLYRTNPKGQPNAGWMCEKCIATKEPELHKNLISDGDVKIANDILKAIKKA